MTLSRYRPHLIAMMALALPLTGSHLARIAIGVTDTLMIGWYGVDELAAIVLATSLFFVIFMLGSGFGIGLMGVIATAIARGDRTETRRATRMALWLSVLHALIVLPFFWHSGAILLALGQKPEIAALAQDYLRVMGFAMAPALWGLTLNSLMAALGRANIVLLITVAAIPVNALLNWVMIFGHFGVPEMGVLGSAVASFIANLFQMGLLAFCAIRLKETREFQIFGRFWRPDWPAFRAIFMLGAPIGLTLVAETGMFVGTNIMMGWIGKLELAAHGIALQLASIAFMIHLGLANAVTIRIGTYYGQGNVDSMRDAGKTALGLSVLFAAVAITIFLTMSRTLAGLYLDAGNPDAAAIITLVAGLMILASMFQLADGVQVVALGMLRGVHDTRMPMVYAVISYWVVGLPAGWVLAFPLGMGPHGLWLGLLFGLLCAAALLTTRFWRGLNRGWTQTPAAV